MLPFLRRLLPASASARRKSHSRTAFRPRVEPLEDRLTPTLSFAAQQTLTVADPRTVIVADIDGDGRQDLVTLNSANLVSVRLNTTAAGATTPSFTAEQTFAVGTSPSAVAVGDFNGDGRADLAVANGGSNTVSVLLNTAATGATTTSFATQTSSATAAGPTVVAVGDFNGDGRPDLAVANVNNVSVLANTSTGGTVTGPTLIGQFGTTGVWRYNRTANAWDQLTGANATALASASNGMAVLALGGNGVYLYRPSVGFQPINGTPAAAVALDPLGNVYVSFAGYGTFLYRLATGSYTLLTASVADKLAASANGDVVGNFGGFGVYRYRPTTGWVSLATPDTNALAIGENGDIAANFGAYGVYRFKAGTWTLINSNAATSLAVGANGSVAASFGSFGVAKYIPYANGWQSLHAGTQAPSVAMDLYGNVFATLSGFGVYEFDPFVGWRVRRASDAGLLGLDR